MADETALKLGYTQEEIESRKHIAMNMDLEEAIKLGLVVNPKIVSCEYMLKEENGGLDNLSKRLEVIDDEEERKILQEKIDELRRKLDKADGIEKILQDNLKPGGKYIVFIPVMDQEQNLEDEEGNSIEKRTSQEKVEEYEQKIREYLKNSGITPQFHSMLGAYGDKKNQAELEAFEADKSDETKFMIVMNKANEGLHISGLDGMIWARPLDENSKILFLQQLGRVIYSEDPNNPTPDDKRPVVIDLVNNIGKVNLDKDMKKNSNRDDLELLSIVVDWVNEHEMLPNIESTRKKEQRYAATLYRIQEKYGKYIQGFEKFPDLDEAEIKQIKLILEKGTEIDLWDIELPPKSKEFIEKTLNVDMFEVKGLRKDYVDIENEILEYNNKIPWQEKIDRLEQWCKKANEGKPQYLCRFPKLSFYVNGKYINKRSNLNEEQQEEIRISYLEYTFRQTTMYKEYMKGNKTALTDNEISIVEKYLNLAKEYDYIYLNNNAKKIIELEDWCKKTFKDKPIETRRMPKMVSNKDGTRIHIVKKREEETEEQSEFRNASFVAAFKRSEIYLKYKNGSQNELNDAERDLVERFAKIEAEYDNNPLKLKIDELEKWCKETFEGQPRYMRRLPTRDDTIKRAEEGEIETKEQKEARLARELKTLKRNCEKYSVNSNIRTETNTDFSEEDIEQYERLKKIIEDYDISYTEKYISIIENWTKNNCNAEYKFMRRVPRQSIKNNGIPLKVAQNDEEETKEQEELRIGGYRKKLEKLIKDVSAGKKDVSEHERKLIDEYLKFKAEYDMEYLNVIGAAVLEMKKWCNEQFEGQPKSARRMPRVAIKINGQKVRAVKDGEIETEEQREIRIGCYKYVLQGRDFYIKYTEGKLDELNEAEKELVELYLEIVNEYDMTKITGQDIGKAGFSASVEQCDEAQVTLNELIKKDKEGGIKRNE